MRHGFLKTVRNCAEPFGTSSRGRQKLRVELHQIRFKWRKLSPESASIPTITSRIRTSLEIISHNQDYEWSGRLHARVGGDGEQAGLHVGGVQQVQGLVAAEHGQSHRGRGQEDGCRHLETVGEEVAASDWSEMWHLSSDWPMSLVLSTKARL